MSDNEGGAAEVTAPEPSVEPFDDGGGFGWHDPDALARAAVEPDVGEQTGPSEPGGMPFDGEQLAAIDAAVAGELDRLGEQVGPFDHGVAADAMAEGLEALVAAGAEMTPESVQAVFEYGAQQAATIDRGLHAAARLAVAESVLRGGNIDAAAIYQVGDRLLQESDAPLDATAAVNAMHEAGRILAGDDARPMTGPQLARLYSARAKLIREAGEGAPSARMSRDATVDKYARRAAALRRS